MAPSIPLSESSVCAVPPCLRSRAILVTKPTSPAGLVLSAWAQGYMVGSIIVMIAITVANMRRGVLLHKLILLELVLGIFHGTYIFPDGASYAWYLSATALFLNVSWSLHNVIAWMKNRPFLSRRASLFYIITVALAQPYWVLEIYADFAYFGGQNRIFVTTRPLEALFRDPWWLFTTISLFYNIQSRYEFTFVELIRISPRFGILLVSMLTSLAFIILDILAVTDALKHLLPAGIDPFWELAFVFKLLCDSVVLDDFKTALDRLHDFKVRSMSRTSADGMFGAVNRNNAPRGPSFASTALPNANTNTAAEPLQLSPEKSRSRHVEDPRLD